MSQLSRIAVLSAATSVLAVSAAYGGDAKNQGYLTDRNGRIVTSARTGDCMRSRDWTPARAGSSCKSDAMQAVRSKQ